ncbi:hypothetical protein RUND412_008662 [Rhizina undulata]
MPSFKEDMSKSPYVGKPIDVGDLYWGKNVTLHTSPNMKEHLGWPKGKNKMRKYRGFYVLQIVNRKYLLACATTTLNGTVWDGIQDKHHKYFLPIGKAPSVPGRDPIAVKKDWNHTFGTRQSLLFLENIVVVRKEKLFAYICSAEAGEINRIKSEARVYVPLIQWPEDCVSPHRSLVSISETTGEETTRKETTAAENTWDEFTGYGRTLFLQNDVDFLELQMGKYKRFNLL